LRIFNNLAEMVWSFRI